MTFNPARSSVYLAQRSLLLETKGARHNMEHSSELKLRIWDETSRSNQLQTKAAGKQWRRRFFSYLGAVAATVAIATLLPIYPASAAVQRTISRSSCILEGKNCIILRHLLS